MRPLRRRGQRTLLSEPVGCLSWTPIDIPAFGLGVLLLGRLPEHLPGLFSSASGLSSTTDAQLLMPSMLSTKSLSIPPCATRAPVRAAC